MEANLGGILKLAEPLLKYAARRQGQKELNTLRRLLESGAQGAVA